MMRETSTLKEGQDKTKRITSEEMRDTIKYLWVLIYME